MSEGKKQAENNGQWIKDLDRLIYQACDGAEVLHYQLKLLQIEQYSGLLVPEAFSAYKPSLLVYSLAQTTCFSRSKLKDNLLVLLSILQSYCTLRSQMQGELLEYKRIVLDEDFIFLSADEGSLEPQVSFLYLPVLDEANDDALEEKQLEALSVLVEKTILLAKESGLLSDNEIAAWIQSSYSNFEQFKALSSSFYIKLKGEAALSEHPNEVAVSELKEGFTPNKPLKVKSKTKNPFNKMGLSLMLCILLSLIIGNVVLQINLIDEPFWQKPLAIFFLLIAIATTIIALIHPKSPFHVEKSRFQKEREGSLAALLNGSSTLSSMSAEDDKDSANSMPSMAYLMLVPSTQGLRLKTVEEIKEAKVELFLSENALKFGSDPRQSQNNFGYKDEAGLHSSIHVNEEGAWLELIDPYTKVYINNALCDGSGPHLLPDHCLLQFGPVLREFYRERSLIN